MGLEIFGSYSKLWSTPTARSHHILDGRAGVLLLGFEVYFEGVFDNLLSELGFPSTQTS